MVDSTFLTRVALKNYRSIASCDVKLGPLTFLVGPNGSGKSNFLEALRFVADSLNNPLDYALRTRGGIEEVADRQGDSNKNNIEITLELKLPNGYTGSYYTKVGNNIVFDERLMMTHASSPQISYETAFGGGLGKTTAQSPPATSGRELYLRQLSGMPEFRPLYDAIKQMSFYNLNPDRIRQSDKPLPADVLDRDGANLSSVLYRFEKESPNTRKRIEEYLSTVTPGILSVGVGKSNAKETIGFRCATPDGRSTTEFTSLNMSDGTLRALGNLVALFQSRNGLSHHPPLIGIEEPETALHPAASGALRDAIAEASEFTQVLVTSHSADLLDDRSISADQILAVVSDQGATRIGAIDKAGRSVLPNRLFTVGEMLRIDQLQPEPTDCNTPTPTA